MKCSNPDCRATVDALYPGKLCRACFMRPMAERQVEKIRSRPGLRFERFVPCPHPRLRMKKAEMSAGQLRQHRRAIKLYRLQKMKFSEKVSA